MPQFLEHVRRIGTFDANGRVEIPVFTARTARSVTVSRLIAAVDASAGSTSIQDSFNRTVASGWGTPDIGAAYVVLAGAAANYSVSVTEGVIAAAAARRAIASPATLKDMNILATVTSANLAGANNRFRVLGRTAAAADTYYAVEVRDAVAGGIDTIRLIRTAAGTDTALTVDVAIAPVLVAPFYMRLKIIGAAISGSAWAATEPANPQVSATDLTLTSGGAGIGSTMAAVVSSSWDNLIVVNAATDPIWDGYIGDTSVLANIVDSSVTTANRWIPVLVNGQRIEAGETLNVVGRSGPIGALAVVSGYMVFDE